MFTWLQDGIITFVTLYLALVNQLAFHIDQWFPDSLETETEVTIPEGSGEAALLDKIKSNYEYGGSLPDILIKNSAYQQATAIGATSLPSPKGDLSEAVVNIFCTYYTPGYKKTSTGTGFIVSDTGVIMTNAHVAQFLLLEEMEEAGEADCTIRTGTIASPSYEAELLYISPSWIQKNSEVISATVPTGTGERDFALLYITKDLNSDALPVDFSYLPLQSNNLTKADVGGLVTLAGYPADSLNASNNPNLRQKSADSKIADIYTFGSGEADIFTTYGTEIGEGGVSGGPVINTAGEVIGMISTRSDDSSLGAGSLNAITISHIDRTIQAETGFGLIRSIGGNLPYRASLFKETIVPFLTNILAEEL